MDAPNYLFSGWLSVYFIHLLSIRTGFLHSSPSTVVFYFRKLCGFRTATDEPASAWTITPFGDSNRDFPSKSEYLLWFMNHDLLLYKLIIFFNWKISKRAIQIFLTPSKNVKIWFMIRIWLVICKKFSTSAVVLTKHHFKKSNSK